MRRICLLVLAGLAGGTFGGPARPGTSDETAPKSGLEDGSRQAPICKVQHPQLLAGYANRPPWRVAGLDYCVGYPKGLALKDPAGITMDGVSVDLDRRAVVIEKAGVTLDGYDFSLRGGYSVRVLGAPNVSIKNSNFLVGPSQMTIPIQSDPGSPNLYVGNTVIDGGGKGGAGGDAAAIWSLIQVQGSGVTLEYNWLKNAPQHVVELSDGPLTYRYNLVEAIGFYRGAHPNGTQFNGGVHRGSRIAFNVFYAPQPEGEFPLGLGEAIQVSAQLKSEIRDTEVDHNTIVTTGPVKTASYAIAFHEDPPKGQNTNVGGTVHDNYIDSVGAFGPFYTNSGGAHNITYANNRNLRTGARISLSP